MTLSEGVTAAVTLLVALAASFGGSVWLLRRQNRKLLEAQASREEAEADRIHDEIARGWIKDLQAEVRSLKERLKSVDDERLQEQFLRRVAINYVIALLSWINWNMGDPPPASPVPAVPEKIREYI